MISFLESVNVKTRVVQWAIANDLGFTPKGGPENNHNFNFPQKGQLPRFCKPSTYVRIRALDGDAD